MSAYSSDTDGPEYSKDPLHYPGGFVILFCRCGWFGRKLCRKQLKNLIIRIKTDEKIARVDIHDVSGQIVKSVSTQLGFEKINISSLVPGIYIVRIYDEGNAVSSNKLIIN